MSPIMITRIWITGTYRFAVVMYLLNFGFGESVADGLACAILVALILYGQGRTRPLLRRIAKRS
jgi:hypothetical protein